MRRKEVRTDGGCGFLLVQGEREKCGNYTNYRRDRIYPVPTDLTGFILQKWLSGYPFEPLLSGSSSFLDSTTPVFSPIVCRPPKKRACSILMHLSCT